MPRNWDLVRATVDGFVTACTRVYVIGRELRGALVRSRLECTVHGAESA